MKHRRHNQYSCSCTGPRGLPDEWGLPEVLNPATNPAELAGQAWPHVQAWAAAEAPSAEHGQEVGGHP